MNEQVKAFLAKASEDEVLKVKLDALADLPKDEVAEKVAAVAREAGFDLAAEDFHPASAELDASELDAVAGGTHACWCDWSGWGAGGDGGDVCSCSASGSGQYEGGRQPEGSAWLTRCFCSMDGGGE